MDFVRGLPGVFLRNFSASMAVLAASLPTNAQADRRPDILWMRGGHSQSVRTVAYSPDGALFVSGSDDWTVKIWRVADRQLIRTLVPTNSAVVKVVFSPDGSRLAVGTGPDLWDEEGAFVVKIYDTASFGEVFTVDGGAEDLAFSQDGNWMAIAGGERIELRRTTDWGIQHTLLLPDGEDVTHHGMQFSSDSTKLVCGLGSDDNAVVALWRVMDGALLWSTNLLGNDAGPVVFAPNGSELLCGVSARWAEESGALQVRSVADGSLLRTWTATNISGIAVSPESSTIVLQTRWDPFWQIRAWPSEAVAYEIPNPYFYGGAVFSPGGQFFAAGGGLYQPAAAGVIIWRKVDGQQQPGFDEHGGKIDGVLFSPDSSLLVSRGSDNTLRFWRAANGERLLLLEGYRLNALAFSPDGTRLLVGDGFGSVRFLCPSNGSLITNLTRTSGADVGPASGAAFSNDGKFVAVRFSAPSIWNPYGEIDVFNTTNGAVVFSAGFYSSGPVFFTADGTLLQAPSTTGRLGQWRVSDWQEMEAPFYAGPWGIRSPDDRFRAWHMSGSIGGPPGGLTLNGNLLETGGGSGPSSQPVMAFARLRNIACWFPYGQRP
jgi:WD40 repeat protein